jgi:hypothetical protein
MKNVINDPVLGSVTVLAEGENYASVVTNYQELLIGGYQASVGEELGYVYKNDIDSWQVVIHMPLHRVIDPDIYECDSIKGDVCDFYFPEASDAVTYVLDFFSMLLLCKRFVKKHYPDAEFFRIGGKREQAKMRLHFYTQAGLEICVGCPKYKKFVIKVRNQDGDNVNVDFGTCITD